MKTKPSALSLARRVKLIEDRADALQITARNLLRHLPQRHAESERAERNRQRAEMRLKPI